MRDGAGGIGAQPVAAQFAMRIDALHGEAGQILHLRSLSGRQLRGSTRGTCGKSSPRRPQRNDGAHCGPERDRCQGKRATRYCGVIALWKSALLRSTCAQRVRGLTLERMLDEWRKLAPTSKYRTLDAIFLRVAAELDRRADRRRAPANQRHAL